MVSSLRVALFTVLVLLSGISGAVTPGDREYQIKLAFLTNFISYTQWPESLQKSSEFSFCSSSQRFIDLAQPQISSKPIEEREVALKVVEPSGEWQCDLLFILAEDGDKWADYLAEVQPEGVLIVGEQRGFARQAGIINFFLAGNNVRFEINLDTLEESGLKISSRLLRLAKLIRREGSDD